MTDTGNTFTAPPATRIPPAVEAMLMRSANPIDIERVWGRYNLEGLSLLWTMPAWALTAACASPLLALLLYFCRPFTTDTADPPNSPAWYMRALSDRHSDTSDSVPLHTIPSPILERLLVAWANGPHWSTIDLLEMLTKGALGNQPALTAWCRAFIKMPHLMQTMRGRRAENSQVGEWGEDGELRQRNEVIIISAMMKAGRIATPNRGDAINTVSVRGFWMDVLGESWRWIAEAANIRAASQTPDLTALARNGRRAVRLAESEDGGIPLTCVAITRPNPPHLSTSQRQSHIWPATHAHGLLIKAKPLPMGYEISSFIKSWKSNHSVSITAFTPTDALIQWLQALSLVGVKKPNGRREHAAPDPSRVEGDRANQGKKHPPSNR